MSVLSPDAAILKLVDEIFAVHARAIRIHETADVMSPQESDRIMQTQVRPLARHGQNLRAELAMTPATTMDGFRAKARIVQHFCNCSPRHADPYADDAMAWSLANDLLGEASLWKRDGGEAPT